MTLRLATLCVLAFPSVLCTPKEPGALTKDGFCCCDSSSQCESGNCVKGWCQAQGFVDQTAQGMTAGRHAVLNTPVQTAGHPSSTAAAIAALAPGSLEPLTVLLQTGLVASAKAGVASASLSPVERLHWEKHNSPLPPDPPPVTAPAAAAPVAAVAAHFEPESTKVAASAPKRATPAVAAPAVAARPHAGAAAVDAAAALAAAHATVFTTTALADAVAAIPLMPTQLHFKALRGPDTPAEASGAATSEGSDAGEGNSSEDPVKADIFGSLAELASTETPDREVALPPPKGSSRSDGPGSQGWLGGATPREEGTQELSNVWNSGAGGKGLNQGLKVSPSTAAAVKAAAAAAKLAPRFNSLRATARATAQLGAMEGERVIPAAGEVLIQVCRPPRGPMWLDIVDSDGYRFAQGLRPGIEGGSGKYDSTTDEVLPLLKGSSVGSPLK